MLCVDTGVKVSASILKNYLQIPRHPDTKGNPRAKVWALLMFQKNLFGGTFFYEYEYKYANEYEYEHEHTIYFLNFFTVRLNFSQFVVKRLSFHSTKQVIKTVLIVYGIQ